MSQENIYNLQNVTKSFQGSADSFILFKDLNLSIPQGQTLAIVGSSGSGKSTLLHLMGALDTPDNGKIWFKDKNILNFSPEEQAHFRNRSIGFVFQFHHLLPEFTTLENILVPGLIARKNKSELLPKAEELIKRVGLEHRIDSKPATLSGGERQRVAIARALLLDPAVILADEPTGNLDEKTGERIVDLLLGLNRERGVTLVTVTHNIDIASRMDKSLELRAGELYEKTCN